MNRRQERRRHGHEPPAIDWPERLRLVVLGTAVALIVCGTLIPSESTVRFGAYAPLAAVWCVLFAVWAIGQWLSPRPAVTFGWTELAGLALVAWFWAAGLFALSTGNGRQALNVVWLTVSYGLAAFLFRQTLRSAAEVRGLVAAMLWLATLQSLVGYYQYFIVSPADRRGFEKNPEEFLLRAGENPNATPAERQRFADRLNSKEPIGTFALTNSLAGLLAPWLIGGLAIGFAAWGDAQQRRLAISALVAAILLAGCLVLTKSRTAYLAAGAGVALLAMYGRERGWRLDWRIPAAGVAVIVVLALGAVYFGGLDAEVLSEAPKSVLYRLEYWRATAAMIADHPLLGCGPGNFAENYVAYKLPQASEEISDPHSFLLEIWSTAGTPALVLTLLLGAAFILDLGRILRAAAQTPQPSKEQADLQVAQWTLLGGALAGLIAAQPLGLVVDMPLRGIRQDWSWLPQAWLLGVPSFAAAWWAFGPWIASGRVTLAALILPQVVLLVNLLAAGAVVFPGVMGTLLVLAPAALCFAGESTTAPDSKPNAATQPLLPRQWLLPNRAMLIVALAGLWLTFTCIWIEYWPVLASKGPQEAATEALATGRIEIAELEALRAAVADGFSPGPSQILAYTRLERWLQSNKDEDWKAFEDAAAGLRDRDPQHHLTYLVRGTWYLTAWRKSQDLPRLEQAIAEFREASKRYPTHAANRAQLAWALHLAGRDDEARREADEAKRLDVATPHKDRKLKEQTIVDPQYVGGRIVVESSESAEQIVEQLRKLGGGPPKPAAGPGTGAAP